MAEEIRKFGSKGATEAIADINPEDIESISVLTGAQLPPFMVVMRQTVRL